MAAFVTWQGFRQHWSIQEQLVQIGRARQLASSAFLSFTISFHSWKGKNGSEKPALRTENLRSTPMSSMPDHMVSGLPTGRGEDFTIPFHAGLPSYIVPSLSTSSTMTPFVGPLGKRKQLESSCCLTGSPVSFSPQLHGETHCRACTQSSLP